jgi:hypothetical protein
MGCSYLGSPDVSLCSFAWAQRSIITGDQMKLQVLEPFAPNLFTSYNVGDVIEVDDTTAKSLIESGRAVEGEIKPYKNFNPYAPKKTKFFRRETR